MFGSCSSISTDEPSKSRKPLLLPGFAASLMPKNNSPMRASSPAAFTALSAAAACISVSPVPPDFEIAMKRVVASGSFASSAP